MPRRYEYTYRQQHVHIALAIRIGFLYTVQCACPEDDYDDDTKELFEAVCKSFKVKDRLRSKGSA